MVASCSASSPISLTQWFWFGIICAHLQNPNLFWLCVSYHILYLCSGEEHPSHGPQEDHRRRDPKIWQPSSSLKRSDDKYSPKLTFISGRIEQQRQAKYPKSITKFFDHNRTMVRERTNLKYPGTMTVLPQKEK